MAETEERIGLLNEISGLRQRVSELESDLESTEASRNEDAEKHAEELKWERDEKAKLNDRMKTALRHLGDAIYEINEAIR